MIVPEVEGVPVTYQQLLTKAPGYQAVLALAIGLEVVGVLFLVSAALVVFAAMFGVGESGRGGGFVVVATLAVPVLSCLISAMFCFAAGSIVRIQRNLARDQNVTARASVAAHAGFMPAGSH